MIEGMRPNRREPLQPKRRRVAIFVRRTAGVARSSLIRILLLIVCCVLPVVEIRAAGSVGKSCTYEYQSMRLEVSGRPVTVELYRPRGIHDLVALTGIEPVF